MTTLEQTYRTHEVAASLQVSTKTVLNLVRAGLVRPVKLPGGQYRWDAGDVAALKEALREPAVPAPRRRRT